MGYRMIWVKFQSLDDFNEWHNTIKNVLGLPKISTDIQGNLKPESTITINYVEPIIVSESDVRALIDEKYNSSLELSENPIISVYA